MIKRRFYKLEHGDRDGPSNSSSSSSDSEIEPHATYDSDEEEEEYDAVEQLKDDAQSCSTSSGYQSEDSSANEVPVDSSDTLSIETPRSFRQISSDCRHYHIFPNHLTHVCFGLPPSLAPPPPSP
ncbi:hypothetical protein ACFXTO_025911 [Malus domestica]|uniref:uncharacterized protein isoform X1 n=1 Tax=Malus domestica TaxID=3750 RepID=UPI00397616E0